VETTIFDAIRSIFPIKKDGVEIQLRTIYTEKGKEYGPKDFKAQKNAVESGMTYGPAIYGEFTVSKNGKVVQKMKKKIGTLPVQTDRGTFIVKGIEYSLVNQLLLKPGVYAREKNNGEIEAIISIKGLSPKIIFDPKTLKASIMVRQSKTPVYPLLKILGVSDTKIQQTFGDKIFNANHINDISPDALKLYSIFYQYKDKPKTVEEAIEGVRAYFEGASIDPNISKITLGMKADKVTGDVVLKGVKKVIDIYRGVGKPDNRDDVRFKRIRDPKAFVRERLEKNAKGIAREIMYNVEKRDKLVTYPIHKTIEKSFTQAITSEIPMGINPASIVGAMNKTTIMGEDGISSVHGIPEETRNISPSQIGFIDPINTPESLKAGVNVSLTANTSSHNGDLATDFIDVKSGKRVRKTSVDIEGHYVALPGEYKDGKFTHSGKIQAVKDGVVESVPKSEISYAVPGAEEAFSTVSNLIPFMNHNQGNRAAMGSRQIQQATAIKDPDVPLVQVAAPDVYSKYGDTTEKVIAKMTNAVSAPENGTIIGVSKDRITMKTSAGKKVVLNLYDNFPLANKSFITNKVLVKPGDKVKKGDVLADTNFSKNGTLAIGKNLKVAYMPWKGGTFEDGMVVSESAAKKLTSEHMIHFGVDISKGVLIDKKRFVAMYPTKYTKEQLDKIDQRGIILKGSTVEPGDPLILVLREETGGPEDLVLQKLHKTLTRPYKDRSVTWEYNVPGKVTSATLPVARTGKATVYVRADLPSGVGDKVALRHGMKGVITQIVPDDEMPFSKDTNEPAEMIISPAGVITRMSIGQMLEAGASKVAKKNGKPYVVKNFSGEDDLSKIQAGLKKAGFNPDGTEEFIDKKTGKSYGRVLTGYPQVNKLFKITKANFSARAQGAYDLDLRPKKGGEEGAKAIDFPQTFYALTAHGARANLRDAATYKGEYSPEAWDAMLSGKPLPPPKTPFAYKKFESMLTGAGIQPRRDGSNITISPLTNSDTKEMSEDRVIKNSAMLKSNMTPEPGGLFDPYLTGGTNGSLWSRMDLADSVPNPMFEQGIKTLTGLKSADYKDIISGKKSIDPKTLAVRDDSSGLVGGDAFKALLDHIDVDKEIAKINDSFKSASATQKVKLSKKLKILMGFKKSGKSLSDALVMKHVPVLPPNFRPVFELPNGMVGVSGVNYLYRDIDYVNNAIKAGKDLPASEKGKLRSELYDAVGAMQGVSEPVSRQSKQQNIVGLTKEISGTTPKTGFFQSRVMRKQQDLSGRATVALGRGLSMDELQIPEKMAQKMYGPFAMKILIGMGYKPDEAQEQITDLTETGRRALNEAMKDRPILMNRAPSLHKFSIMAFKPKMYDGLTIKVPGLITHPYNMDFDGDTVQVHVPFSEEARKEAFNMLPSNNLHQVRSRGLNYVPDQEAIIGLYLLTEAKRKTNKKYSTLSNAIADMRSKKISVTDEITIGRKKTTIGRELVNQILPDELDVKHQLTKKEVSKLLETVAKTHKSQYASIVKKLKDLGDDYSTDTGFTVTLNDLKVNSKKAKDTLVAASKTGDLDAIAAADNTVANMARNTPANNNFAKMVRSGGRGSSSNLKQILYAPGLVTDMHGDVIPKPITSSYADGLDYSDYFTSLYGVRHGVINVATVTALPGAFNKEVLASTANVIVTMHDCKTKEGIMMDKKDPNIVGRVLAEDYGEIKRNSVLTSFALSKLPAKVKVRSPITCEAHSGVCQMCYGYDENGSYPPLGSNVGVTSTQAMVEPLTQAALKVKHTGGLAGQGGSNIGGFWSIRQFAQNPKTFAQKATIVTNKGTIDKIEKREGGGYNISVAGKKYVTSPRSKLVVKKGDKVVPGQKLNVGIGQPQELLDVSGPKAVVDEMHSMYKNTGINIDPKHIETVYRNIMGYGEITDSGDDYTHLPGDIVPISSINSFNKGAKNKIQYKRTVVGVNKAHNVSDSWMSRLGFRNLTRGLQEGALYGQSTDVHSTSPIPPYATGEINIDGISY